MTVAITSVLDKPIQERKLRLHQGDEEDYWLTVYGVIKIINTNSITVSSFSTVKLI